MTEYSTSDYKFGTLQFIKIQDQQIWSTQHALLVLVDHPFESHQH